MSRVLYTPNAVEPFVSLTTGKITRPWQGLQDAIVEIVDAAVIGPGTSVDGQLAVFDGTGGDQIDGFGGTGIVHVASGVPTASNVLESEITLADNTTNNVTTGRHGFAPKLPGGTTTFLRADGSYAVPAGSGGTVSGPGVSVVGHLATWADITGTTLADGGAVPAGGSGDDAFAFFMG